MVLAFDLGGGPAVIPSNVKLQAGSWYKIEAERTDAQGSLVIDGGVAVKGEKIDVFGVNHTL